MVILQFTYRIPERPDISSKLCWHSRQRTSRQSKDKGECSVIEQVGVAVPTSKLNKQTPGDPEKEVYDGNITDNQNGTDAIRVSELNKSRQRQKTNRSKTYNISDHEEKYYRISSYRCYGYGSPMEFQPAQKRSGAVGLVTS